MERIGYIVPEFPGQTHAFFWREISAIEDQNVKITIISTKRPKIGSCPHDFAETAFNRTRYLFPPSLSALLNLFKSFGKGIACIKYIMGLRETPFYKRLPLLMLVFAAVDLLEICKSERLQHVHIHSCANAAHLGALLKILGGPTYSLTLHGDLPVYGTDHKSKFQRASFVSAVTSPLAKQINNIVPKKAAPVIWMGVDCDEFVPSSTPQDVNRQFTIITVARLNRTKGHIYVLDAIARLTQSGYDMTYRIIGEGPEEAAIREKVAELGLTEQVRLEGMLGELDVKKALVESDVMILASFGLGEAAPVTVMEAMASGLPVIVSRIGGTPEMITDGVNGTLTNQEDVSDIEEAIRKHIEDKAYATRIGSAARATAVQEFDSRTNSLKLLTEIRNREDPV